MEKKAILYGINSYGYEFQIPVVVEDWQDHFNTVNRRTISSFLASVFVVEDGQTTTRHISFKGDTGKDLLRWTQLYWTKVCFEDGTELTNKNNRVLLSAANFNKELLVQKYGKEFDDGLNKFVGHPVCAKNNVTDAYHSGLLLGVEPRKDHSPMAHVMLGDNATFILPVDDTTKIDVYPLDGTKPAEIKQIADDFNL